MSSDGTTGLHTYQDIYQKRFDTSEYLRIGVILSLCNLWNNLHLGICLHINEVEKTPCMLHFRATMEPIGYLNLCHVDKVTNQETMCIYYCPKCYKYPD